MAAAAFWLAGSGCGDEFANNPMASSGSAAGGATTTTTSGSGGSGGAPFSCTPGDTVDCYTGPPGTADVGVCRPGSGTCNASGDGVDDCSGDVLPAREDCGTTFDDDCDGVVNDHCVQDFAFLPSTDSILANSMAVDGAGNFFVVGNAQGDITLDLSTTVVCETQNDDAFIVKLDANLEPLWGLCAGDVGQTDRLRDVAVGADGHPVIVGTYRTTMDWAGTVLDDIGNDNAFIVKLDQAGTSALWARTTGALNLSHYGSDVAVDSKGDVVAVVSFQGDLSIDGTTLTSAGSLDTAVLKLARDTGTLIWASQIGGSGTDETPRVAITGDDDLIVVGQHDQTLQVGPTMLNNESDNTFVVRLDGATGSFGWARTITGLDFERPNRVAVGGDSVAVAGWFAAELVVPTDTFATVGGGEDSYVVLFDVNDGSVKWAQAFGDADGANQDPYGLIVTADERVYVAGRQEGTVDYGDGQLSSLASGNIVAWAHEADGALRFSRLFASGDECFAADLAIGSSGNLYAFGEANGPVTLGGMQQLPGRGFFVIDLGAS
jgi:hypothetical protein